MGIWSCLWNFIVGFSSRLSGLAVELVVSVKGFQINLLSCVGRADNWLVDDKRHNQGSVVRSAVRGFDW